MTENRPRPAAAALASLFLLATGSVAEGRVVSYAPLTGRPATPAVQKRTNRHALLVEQTGALNFALASPCFSCTWTVPSRLVLHDSAGLEEPRDVTPGGADAGITVAAAREEAGLPPFLLAQLSPGEKPSSPSGFLFSPDGGATWSVLPLPASGAYVSWSADTGGPFLRALGSSVRIGTRETPFFLALHEPDTQRIGLWDVLADGSVKRRAFFSSDSSVIGMDAEGRRALVTGTPVLGPGPGGPAISALYAVNADGSMHALLDLPAGTWFSNGWITPDGRAYVEADSYDSAGRRHAVLLASGGSRTEVASALNPNTTDLFAVPTADFGGAWVLRRGTGPTVLSLHTPAAGLVEAWRDVTRPEVEALHAGASGQRLLVQVHRPRPQVDQRIFKDPALAVWEVGTPAPSSYDELFLNEQFVKAFVHVDPDTIGSGEPFLFDSGSPSSLFIPAGPSGGGGGADVIQEWGVVRGSLKQRLVIPATARANGINGSRWRTDLVLRNPDADPVVVAVRFLPNSGASGASGTPPGDATLTLAPGAILIQSDVLGALFQLESGSGALLLTPENGRSIGATSRTYTSTPEGSYGMSVGAVDVFAGIGAGFPVSFAAGLLGAGFRTNMLATDVSGRGSEAAVVLSIDTADPSAGSRILAAPSWSQAQVNDLGAALGAPPWRIGSLLVTPKSGETVVGAIAIDGATNDPTYFSPDLPATVVRTIPALVHADGANGAAYRSDLYLFNPADGVRTVRLLVKSWSTNETEQTLTLTLLPRESKTIRDALATAFGRTGVARLRFQTDGFADVAGGVRVTSRTWTAGPSGGSYGLLIPALNAFQSAGGGESLEILLPAGGAGFRTNLALVELTSSFVSGPPVYVRVEIFDELGVRRDSFETPLPLAGGVQIDDLFHGRGLGDGPPAGLIRISPSGGLVAAYASVIDNGTNDPMYVAAQLAAND
ncbi:MAG: hypothetical protein NEA02_10350 [Thermoanaerobaculia bacterium]|nr:hypothetical protein [Thermoanaerobaculia bacterium]